MNLNDYETKYFLIYDAFADTVRIILEKALLASENLPRPQSIQCRAKRIESVRRRLAEAGELNTLTLESSRRDLAGARLIFYTNNDVERFLASPIIRDNFEIEEDSTKIHHPTPENKGAQYRAVHYTVRLRDDRIRLPEYMRFANLRCEIQVQTILNHAWSETSHDILYKDKLDGGYGLKAKNAIADRFKRIMDNYLIPAGFEIQKAQQEYERVLQGKELFDSDISKLLDNANNNNERYDILSGLKDYAIPNYDDLPAAYEALKGPLLRVVQTARSAEPVPIETTFGNMEGFKADAVTKLVVEIVESLRYVDVIGTLQLLIDLYRDEPNDDIRREILNAVKNMSEYSIEAYEKVGLMIQMLLLDHLVGISDAEVEGIRPIALTVWTEAIQLDITGTTWEGDSIIISTGAVPVSNQLGEIRGKAINALFAAYDRSTDDPQRREVLSALENATRTPTQVQVSNEHLAITIMDAGRIVEFVTERAESMSYELRQHLEHQFFYEYSRQRGITEDAQDRFGCQAEAKALVVAILRFRDIINADDRFVRYKVLVGFESIYPDHWIDVEFDYDRADKYRRAEADRYIGEINTAQENFWFDLISRCAETKSNDSATFPVFSDFICRLAEQKPEIADRLLAKAPDNLCNFIASFLHGLAMSGQREIYERILESELVSARNLTGIGRHLRYSELKKSEFAARLLARAIEKSDAIAVIECLLFALENYGAEKLAEADSLLRDALTFLNDRKDARWTAEAWFLQKAITSLGELTPERMAQLLENLGFLRKVNHQVEHILVALAKRQPEAVWDYFGARLARESTDDEDEGRFESVPFTFHGLEQELSKDPHLAITKGMSWFAEDSNLFRYRAGRLLSIAFPNCTPEFATALAELVKVGGDSEVDFALAILQNYEGETSTHLVLKEIVSRFPNDTTKLNGVRVCIDNTGVVSGGLGFAEAWRERKESLMEWLADERPVVKAFAETHIGMLDLMISAEHRHAEADREMQIRH